MKKIMETGKMDVVVGTAEDSRLHTVYGGNAIIIQSVRYDEQTVNGEKKLLTFWSLERKADSLTIREGYYNSSQSKKGFVTDKFGYTTMQPIVDEILSLDEIIVDIPRVNEGRWVNALLDDVRYTGVVCRLVINGKPHLLAQDAKDEFLYIILGLGQKMTYEEIIGLAKKEKERRIKNNEVGMPEILTWYGRYVSSVSMQRRELLSFFKIPNSKEDWRDIRLSRVNNLLGRAPEIIMKALGEGEKPIAKVAKKVARFTLPFTNGAKLARPESIAIWTGKFSFADGAGMVSAKFFESGIKDAGFEIKNDAVGSHFQGRFGTCKGYFTVMGSLNAYVTTLAENSRVVYLDMDDIEYCRHIMVRLEKGEFENEPVLIVIGGTGVNDIDMLVDMNVCKAGFIPALTPQMTIMEMPELESGVKLSSQIVGGVMGVEGFAPVMKQIVNEYVDDLFSFEKKEELSLSMLGNDSFVDDTVKLVEPSFLTKDAVLVKKLGEKIKEKAVNDINNYSFKVEGFYEKGVPDYGMFFGKALLANNEFYAPKTHLKNGQEVVVIRHPKMAKEEFAILKSVSLLALKRRVNKLEKETKNSLGLLQVAALREIVSSLKKGAAMFPFQDKNLAAKLGGADLDGDGFDIITDSRIIELYKKLNENAIDFGAIKHSDKMLRFDNTAIDTAYLAQIENGNLPVGKAVVYGYTMRCVAEDIQKRFLTQETWDKLYTYLLNKVRNSVVDRISATEQRTAQALFNKNKSENAVPYVHQLLDEGKAIDVNVIETFASMVYDEFNIRQLDSFATVLADLEPLMSSVVGHIIDAAKNNEMVPCPFWCFFRNMFVSGMRAFTDLVKNKETGIWEPKVVDGGKLKEVKNRLYYVTNDSCLAIKNYAVNVLAEKLNTLEKGAAPNSNLYFPTASVGTRKAISSLAINCTMMFNRMSESKNKDKEIQKVSFINELKPYFLSYLRQLTKTMSPEIRFAEVKEICEYKNLEGGAGRLLSMMGGEILISALNNNDVNLKEELFAMHSGIILNDGDTVNLVKGIDKEICVYTSKKIDGKFSVKRDENGRTFAVSTVKTEAQKWIQNSINDRLCVLKVDTGNAKTIADEQKLIAQWEKVLTNACGYTFRFKESKKDYALEFTNDKLKGLVLDADTKDIRQKLLKVSFELDYVQVVSNKKGLRLLLFGKLE